MPVPTRLPCFRTFLRARSAPLFLFLGLLFFSTKSLYALNCAGNIPVYFASIANVTNCHSGNYFSTTSGGAATCNPITTNAVVFDGGTSGNMRGSCTLGASISVASITITSGYSTGTLNTNNFMVTTSSNFVMTGGNFTAGASTISVGGGWSLTGGAFTINTSTVVFTGGNSGLMVRTTGRPFNNVQFNNSAGTWILHDSMTVVSTMTLTAGTLDSSSNNYGLALGGSWFNYGGNYTTNSSTITFTTPGAGTQTIRTNGRPFANVQFNGTNGYWTLASSLTVTSTMTLTVGTLNTSASNFGIAVGGDWVNTGGFYVTNNSTVTFNSTTGQRIRSRGFLFHMIQLGPASTGGYYTLVDSVTFSTATIGAGNLLETSGLGIVGSSLTVSGTYVLRGTETAITRLLVAPALIAGSTITYNAPSGSPLIMSTWTYRNLQINGTGVTFAPMGATTIAEDLSITAGTLDPTASNYALNVGGSWWNTGGNFTVRASTVTFNGTTSGKLIRSNSRPFGYVYVNGGASSYWTLFDSMTVTSTMTLTAGTLDTSTNDYGLAVGGSWFNYGGSFYTNTSTITFTTPAAGSQTVRTNGPPLYSVDWNGTNGYWTLASSLTVVSTLTVNAGFLDASATNYGIAVGGNWTTNSAGNYNARGSTVTFNGSALNLTIRTNNKAFSAVNFTGAGYWTMQDSMTVSTVTINAGTLDTNSASNFGMAVNRDWFNNGGDFRVNQSTVTFNSTTTNNFVRNAGDPFFNLHFSGAAASNWTLIDSMTVTSTMTLTAGTLNTSASNNGIWVGGGWINNGGAFTTNNSTVTLAADNVGQSLRTRGFPFHMLRLGSASTEGYYTLVDSVTFSSGTIAVGNTLNAFGYGIVSSSLTVGGTLVIRGTETAAIRLLVAPTLIAGSTVTYNAPSGSPIVLSTWTYRNLQINGGTAVSFTAWNGALNITEGLTINSGLLDPSATSFGINVGGDWLNTGGGFTARASTVTFNGTATGKVIRSNTKPFSNVLFSGSNGYWTLIDSMTVTSTMTLTAGTLDTSASNCAGTSCNVSVGGNWTNPVGGSGGFIAQESTVTFITPAAGSQTVTTDGYPFDNVNFQGSGGYWTLGSSLTVISTLTITQGALNTHSNSYGLELDGGLTIHPNNGVFVANSSTVTFSGTLPQMVRNAGKDFWVIIDSNTTSGGLVFASSFTANKLMINGAGLASSTTVYFNATSTFTIVNMLLTGSAGNSIWMRSSNDTDNWILRSTGTQTTVSYVDVEDSDARPGSLIIAANSINSGNNFNWSFLGAPGVVRTWWGTTNRNWSLGTNWDTGAPGAQDSALIVTTATVMPTLNVNVDISSLTINAGSSVTLAGFNLDLSSFTNSGSLSLNGSEQVGRAPNGLAGSTVAYVGTGTLPVLSTWTYRNLWISNAGGTFNLTGPLDVNENLILTAGTLDTTASGYGIEVSSNWLNTAGSFTARTSTVTFSSTNVGQTIRSRGFPFYALRIGPSSTGGFYTLIGSITFSSATFSAGNTIDTFGLGVAGSSLTVGGTFVLRGTDTAAMRLLVAPNFLAGSTVTYNAPSGSPIILSTWTYRNLQVNGGAAVSFTAWNGALNITEGLTINSGLLDPSASSFGISVGGDWLNTGGGFTARASTVTFNGNATGKVIRSNTKPFSYVLFNGSGGYWTLIDSMTVTSTMTFTAGTLDASATNCAGTSCNVSAGGNWTNPSGGSGGFIAQDSTVTFITPAVGSQTVSSDGYPFNNVNFQGSGGYWTLGSSLTVTSTLTITQGTLNTHATNSHGIGVEGGFTILITSGLFVVNSSTVTFGGTTPLMVRNAGKSFWVIIDSNTSSGGLVFTSSFTATTLMVNGAGLASPTTVYFNAASTFTIVNLLLTGSAGNPIWIRSSDEGENWILRSTGTQTNVSYADVEDSDARSGSLIRAANSVNSGHNYNWSFGGLGILRTWWGTTNRNWNLGTNWDTGAPGVEDSVLIVSTASFMPTLNLDVSISSLTVNAGSSITLAGFNLDVSSFTHSGSLSLNGTEQVGQSPNGLAGSTVAYVGTGTLPLLSTWTYRNLWISNAGGTFNMTGPLNVRENLILTAGTLDATSNNYDIDISSNWINTAGFFTARNSTVTFSATNVGQTIRSRGFPFANVDMSGSGGYWTLIDSMTLTSTMTLTAGTLDPSGSNFGLVLAGSWLDGGGTFVPRSSTITFITPSAGSQTVTTNGEPFANVFFNGTGGYWTLGSSLTLTSSMTLTTGTLDVSPAECAGEPCGIALGGSWINPVGGGGNFISRSSTITFTTPAAGSQTITSDGKPFGNIRFEGAGGYWTLVDSLTATSDMIITQGTLDTRLNSNFGVVVGRDWLNTGGSFVARVSTVTFTGTSSGLQIDSNNSAFSNVHFTGVGGYWTLIDSMTLTSTMTLTAGTLDTSATNCAGTSCNMAIAGSWNIPAAGSGIFYAQDSTVTFTTPGVGSQTVTTDGNPFNHVHFNGNSGYWTMMDSMTVLSTATLTVGRLDTRTASSYPIWLGGSWMNNGGMFTVNGSTVIFGATTVGNVIRSRGYPFMTGLFGRGSSGGFWTLIDSVTVPMTTLYAGNTIDLANQGVNITSFTILGDLTLRGTETGSIKGMTVVPSFLAGSTVTYNATSGSPIVLSTWTYANLEFSGSGVSFTALNALTVSENLTLGGGTLDPSTNNYGISVGQDWLGTGGVFNARSSTVTFTGSATDSAIRSSGSPFANVRLNGTGYWTLIDSMTLTSTMTFTAGTLDASAVNCSGTSCNVSIAGTWYNPAGGTGRFIAQDSTVTFITPAAGSQTITTDGNPFNQLDVRGTGGYWTLGSSLTVMSTLTITQGILNTHATSNFGIGLGGDWNAAAGTHFVVNSSTVTFNGTERQTIRSLGKDFWILIDSNTSSGGVVFASSFTANKLTVDADGLNSHTTVYFNATSTFTIVNLMFTGASGQTIFARSTNDDEPWFLRSTGTQTSVTFANVRDSDARLGSLMTALNSTDGGNNLNWNFGGVGLLKTWWGLSSPNWFLGSNWDTGVPSSQDSVLIVSTASFMPTLTANVDISSLTVNFGSSVTLAGFNLGLSSFTNGGSLSFNGSEQVDLAPNGLAGSTVAYVGTGTLPLLSTWTYRNLWVSNAGGTFNMTGPLTLRESLTLTAGTLDTTASNYGIDISSNWINTAGAFTARSSTVTFSATSVGQTIRSRGFPFGNAEFDGVGGYWTLIDSMTLTSTMTLTAGTLDSNGLNMVLNGSWRNTGGTFIPLTSTVTFATPSAGSQTVRTNGSNFSNLHFNGSGGYWILHSSLTLVSTMTVSVGRLDASSTNCGGQSCDIAVGGSWNVPVGANVAFYARTSTVTFVTPAAGSQTLTSDGYPFSHVHFNGAGYWTLVDSITALSDLTITAGTLDTRSGSNLGVLVGGNWNNTGGSFVARAGTVTFNSGGAEQIETNNSAFNNLHFIGSGGYWTLIDSMTLTSTMTITGGTLDASAANCAGISCNLAVAGSWNIPAAGTGIFYARSSTVTFTTPGVGSQTVTTDGNPFNNLHFNGSGGYWTMMDSMTVLSTATFTQGRLDTRAANSYRLWLGGSWMNNGGAFTVNSSTVTFAATQAGQVIRSRGYPFMTGLFGLGSTGGYWTLIDSVTVPMTTLYSGNTIDLADQGISVSSLTVFGDLTLRGTETGLIKGMTVVPSFLTGSTVTYNASSGSPIILSTWTYANLDLVGSNVTFTALNALTINENITLAGGTLDPTSTSYGISVGQDWLNAGGGFTARSSTVTFTGSASDAVIESQGVPFANVRINGTGYWTLIDSMTLTSTMSVTAGTLDVSATNCAGTSCHLAIGGSWNNPPGGSGLFLARSSTVTFTTPAVGTQTVTTDGNPFNHLQFNGNSGFWTLGSSLTVVSTLTITEGTLNTHAANHYGIGLGGGWVTDTSGANFLTNLSTVTFTGSSAQVIRNQGQSFWVLIDSNTSSGGVVFASSFTAAKLMVNSAALSSPTTVYFNAGSTFTITTVLFNGSAGNMVWLRPTPANQTWILKNTSTNTVSYTDVAYSSASAPIVMTAGPRSIDSGNNVNWTFLVLSVALVPSSYDFGTVNLGGTTLSVSGVTVNNTGNDTQSYALSVTTTGATTWGVYAATPTVIDRFVIEGVFNSGQPNFSVFTSTDVITSTPTISTVNHYSGNQTGASVPSGGVRSLWFYLFMPPTTTTETQQSMSLTVTATTP